MAYSPITRAAAKYWRPFSASCGIVSRAENSRPRGAKTNTSRAWSMGFLWSLTTRSSPASRRGVDDHDVAGSVMRDLVGDAPEDKPLGRSHTLRAHDDHVPAGAVGRVDQQRRRVPAIHSEHDVVHARLAGDGECPSRPLLG